MSLPYEAPQALPNVRELSVVGHNGLVALDISGSVPERILFSPSEAHKLIVAIERALNRGFGRDIDAIRQMAARKDPET